VVPLAAQAIDDPLRVPVRPGRVEQLLQAGRKPGAARSPLGLPRSCGLLGGPDGPC
jgi:hypothetical protein